MHFLIALPTQAPPSEQLHDSRYHEWLDTGHPGTCWQRHHRQGTNFPLLLFLKLLRKHTQTVEPEDNFWKVSLKHWWVLCAPGAPPGASGGGAGKRVRRIGGAAHSAAPGEPPAGASRQRAGGATEGAGGLRWGAAAAGESAPQGGNKQAGKRKGARARKPAGQVRTFLSKQILL